MVDEQPRANVADDRLARALGALYARVPLGMRLGLDAMRASCKKAGHPERRFEIVHVGGTNGKGSTCARVESMARAAGKKTGLYTSPHLCRFAERIRIDGEPMSDALLASALERALDIGSDLSFFETATLAAFLAFADHRVDLAVIEVGIGGRLDATNVIERPKVAAITRVAFDHEDRLGHTLEAIAREKAGIAKPGVPLVVGHMAHAARAVIEGEARTMGAEVVGLESLDWGEHGENEFLKQNNGLPCAYQRENSMIAWALASYLGVDDTAKAKGLARVKWPGRFERIDARDGPYLLDGAHNPDGAIALKESLASSGQKVSALVFGAMADKAWPTMLRVLAPLANTRVYVAPRGHSSRTAREAADPVAFAAQYPGQTARDVAGALALARSSAGPTGLVLVAGSLYLVGNARAELLGLAQDPPVAL
jgi:dihydrofolate synthase/folylpolyglutamate synthase